MASFPDGGSCPCLGARPGQVSLGMRGPSRQGRTLHGGGPSEAAAAQALGLGLAPPLPTGPAHVFHPSLSASFLQQQAWFGFGNSPFPTLPMLSGWGFGIRAYDLSLANQHPAFTGAEVQE